MRLLLDECVPRQLKHDLIGHDVSHVSDMGWSSKRNGELLRPMATVRFAAFLTVDKSLEFQQNIQASGIGVVVALAKTNRVKEQRPLVPQILDALRQLRPGDLIRVGASPWWEANDRIWFARYCSSSRRTTRGGYF